MFHFANIGTGQTNCGFLKINKSNCYFQRSAMVAVLLKLMRIMTLPSMPFGILSFNWSLENEVRMMKTCTTRPNSDGSYVFQFHMQIPTQSLPKLAKTTQYNPQLPDSSHSHIQCPHKNSCQKPNVMILQFFFTLLYLAYQVNAHFLYNPYGNHFWQVP